MKGKKILTLASLAMGVAIVGATFAAWAVTDNADPFGIKVSPSQIKTDDTTFVTLSYGDSTFANVDNLKAGKPRLAGSVLLKADTNEGAGNFNYSVFHIELTDETGTKDAGLAKLIDYLEVDVFDVAITSDAEGTAVIPDGAVAIGHIPAEGETEIDIAYTVPSGTGKVVYVVVSLKADLDPRVITEISEDVVYLGMDWNASETTPIAETSTIYVAKDSGADLYCYAWDESGKNAEWPGVKMNDMGNGYYSYELKVNFKNVIFNISSQDQSTKEWSTSWQTVDLAIGSDQLGTKPTFKPNTTTTEEGKYDGVWQAKPDPELTADYYLVGDKKGDWMPVKANAMAKIADNHYQIEGVSLLANELIKVTNPNRTVWYSNESTYDNCGYTLDASGNIIVKEAGTYTVDLYTDSAQHNYVILTKAA